MHGFSDFRSYTQTYLKDVFNVLDPDSQDLDYINIKKVTASSLKKFYQTFHKLITQKITHEYFSEFQDDLEGEFSSGDDLTESDYNLIKIMDEKVLPKILGYPAFASLVTGLLNMEKKSGSYSLSFIAPSRKFLSYIFNRIGIKPLHARNPSTGVYGINYFNVGNFDGFFHETFGSIFTYGLYRILKVEGEYRMYSIMPPKDTLDVLFSDYEYTVQSQSYYTDRRRELSQLYHGQLETLESVDNALEQMVYMLSIIKEISIEDFLIRFQKWLEFIPFDLNKITIENFIDYYSLNLQVEGDNIINNDYNPLIGDIHLFSDINRIWDILSKIKSMFDSSIRSIEETLLMEFVGLSRFSLMKLMFEYASYAGINFYYSNEVYYNKDKIL
jgi:hypothetical protein